MTDNDQRRTPLPGENRDGWMMFRTGPLQLLDLRPDEMDIHDIVHGLSRINRFNGQSAEPIPVLWHSLMVMQLCAGHDVATRTEALFHDAGETYVGDWIRPLHSVCGDRLLRLRETIQETVFEAVGLPGQSALLSTPVRQADELLLRCEMESPWGYGRLVSWYKAPSEAERTAVQNAMAEIGCPPANKIDHERLRTLFLDQADELVPPTAPMRPSIDRAKFRIA